MKCAALNCQKTVRFVCGRCMRVNYCSAVCQRKHWHTAHKNYCEPYKPCQTKTCLRPVIVNCITICNTPTYCSIKCQLADFFISGNISISIRRATQNGKCRNDCKNYISKF